MSPSMQCRDANWIDGLRGTASFMVVVGHLCTSFVPHLHSPTNYGQGPELFQLPFFRLCVSGRTATALFFLITGYVNTIGPLTRAKNGDVDAAYAGLGRSVLARSFRFILPTSIATFISWILANIDAYWMTEFVDSVWIRQGHHPPYGGHRDAIYSLAKAEIGTWTTLWNENYDGTQWTLIYLLQGSMVAYLLTAATLQVTPTARRLVLAVIWAYGWLSGSALVLMNVAFGVFVADLQVQYGDSVTSVHPVFSLLLMIAGMFCAGFPQDAPESRGWSETMRGIMFTITPQTADLRRYWDSIAASLLLVGVLISPLARRVLTSPILNACGRASFPVYLLHNELIKTVLTWMVYFPSALIWSEREENVGEVMILQKGPPIYVIACCCVFFFILYRVAWLWTVHVDPLCLKAVKWITAAAHGEHSSNGLFDRRKTLG